MYPNGGTSHFTPMFQRPRALMFAGSGGSFAAFAGPFAASGPVAPVCLAGWADPVVAHSNATIATPMVVRENRFIEPSPPC